MRTHKLNHLFIWLISFASYGQKYYTDININWNNTSNELSLNEPTSCDCFSGNCLLINTLIKKQKIKLKENIAATSNSNAQFNSNPQLSKNIFNSNFKDSQKVGATNYTKITGFQSEINTDLTHFQIHRDDKFTSQFRPKYAFHSINILDTTSRILNKIEIGDTFSINLQLPSQNGLHFIQAEGEEITTTYTLVKI